MSVQKLSGSKNSFHATLIGTAHLDSDLNSIPNVTLPQVALDYKNSLIVAKSAAQSESVIQTFEDKINELIDVITKLQSDILELQTELKTSNSTITSLQADLKTAQANVSAAKAESDNLKKSFTATKVSTSSNKVNTTSTVNVSKNITTTPISVKSSTGDKNVVVKK